MYTYSNSILSTTYTVPNCTKNNEEESLNKHNRYFVETVKELDTFNIIKISKNKLDRILQNEVTMKMCHKSSFQKNISSSRRHEHLNLKKDWDRIPQEVRDEVLKFSNQKKIKKCENTCPCKCTQELIQLYHNAQLLREKAEKLELIENKDRFEINKVVEKLEINDSHEKSEINKNNNNDYYKNISISNVLMTKMNDKNFNANELRNFSEKVTEKLKIHAESNFRNENYFTELKKKVQQIEKIIENFQPQGKIFELKNEQQTIDVALMNQSLFLEENDLCKFEKKIQTILKCKEEWIKEDESYDLERTKARRIETLLVLKSINLMENYIDELKFQIQ